MIRAEEVGWTLISAALFWHLSCTMTLIPFHFPPSLTMSSPTFLALRPRGPSLGARVAAGPGSPPNTLMWTRIREMDTESDFGGVYFWWHRLISIIYSDYLILNFQLSVRVINAFNNERSLIIHGLLLNWPAAVSDGLSFCSWMDDSASSSSQETALLGYRSLNIIFDYFWRDGQSGSQAWCIFP